MFFGCAVERGSRLADPSDPDPGSEREPPEPSPTDPPFPTAPQNCVAAPSLSHDWDHDIKSRAIAALGAPYHGSTDVVTNPGQAVSLRARFVYGLVLKDLEDESIAGWIERGDCEWTELGEQRSDDDGVVSFEVDGALLSEPGAYNFELAVRGDDSRVRGTIWVVPRDLPVVVFDIDGTLTTGDDEIVEEVLLGEEPSMYAAADYVVDAYADAGFFAVYVTGRPMYLDVMTRGWLESRGFAPGPLYLTDGFSQGLLDVQQFKTDTLEDLRDRVGANLTYAYGNASTDICAYAATGIDPADTYIIGDNAGDACGSSAPTQPVEDYPSHLASLDL